MAQGKNGDMQGHIKDANNHPVIAISVYLLKPADSSVVKFTTTDKNGLFVFNNIKSGGYLISVTGMGYQPKITRKIMLGNVPNVDVGTIELTPGTTGLHEVNVTSSSFIEVRSDKTILNIQNSNLMIGNNALEVLNKAPGVQVDNNDNISLNGRSDALVMIDNKPTYLSGSALTDLLRGMQSSMIDKIELISNPNATYDAAGTGGVINIKTVRNKNLGINAQVFGGIGLAQFPDNQYSGVKDIAGINFNYRTKNLNVFGGYNYSNIPAYKSIATDRLDNYRSQTDIIDVDLFINQRRETHNLRIGADFNITPKQTIGFLINDVITNQNGPKNTTSVISNNVGDQNVADSTIITNSSLNRRQTNISYNLNYQADLSKKETLTLNGDYIDYSRQYDEEFKSGYFYSYNNTPYRNLWLQNNSLLTYNVYVISGNYRAEINGNNIFAAGFKATQIKINNNAGFGSITGNVYTPYPIFSGQFNYSEKIGAAYVDYNHMFDKNTSIELGARLEQTQSHSVSMSSKTDDLTNNYWGLFPNVKLNHTINANNQLQLGYGRRIYRPKYDELNPLVLYNDQFTYQIGNPYLKPYYSNLIELKHIYKDKFVTTVSFEAISGFSQVVYMQSDTTQVSILKKQNLGNRYNYTINFLAPFTLTKWYGVDLNLDFKYQHFTGTSTSGDLNSSSPDITFKVMQHFKLPLSVQADLGAYYETPTTFGIYRYKAEYYAYGSLSKSVFKKGAIHLNVDGMFNSDKAIVTSHYQNLNLSSTQIDKFRVITFSFSYALGSQSIKASRKKDSEADEEQIRINSGTN